MPEFRIDFTVHEPDISIAGRAAKGLLDGDFLQVRSSYFKVLRQYPIPVAPKIAQAARNLFRVTKPGTTGTEFQEKAVYLDAPVKCLTCERPAALARDQLPPDGLCPRCRKAGHPLAPHVTKAWEQEVIERSAAQAVPFRGGSLVGQGPVETPTPETLEEKTTRLRDLAIEVLQFEGGREALARACVDAVGTVPLQPDEVRALYQKVLSLEDVPPLGDPKLWAKALGEMHPRPRIALEASMQLQEIPAEVTILAEAKEEAAPETSPEKAAPTKPKVEVGQTWRSKDSRRPTSQFTIRALTETHALGDGKHRVSLERLRRYELVV